MPGFRDEQRLGSASHAGPRIALGPAGSMRGPFAGGDADPAVGALGRRGTQKPFLRGLGDNLLDRQQFKYVWIDTGWRPQ